MRISDRRRERALVISERTERPPLRLRAPTTLATAGPFDGRFFATRLKITGAGCSSRCERRDTRRLVRRLVAREMNRPAGQTDPRDESSSGSRGLLLRFCRFLTDYACGEREILRLSAAVKAVNEYRPAERERGEGLTGLFVMRLIISSSPIARECTNAICSGGLIGQPAVRLPGFTWRIPFAAVHFSSEINTRGNTRVRPLADPRLARGERITFAPSIGGTGGRGREEKKRETSTRRASKLGTRRADFQREPSTGLARSNPTETDSPFAMQISRTTTPKLAVKATGIDPVRAR